MLIRGKNKFLAGFHISPFSSFASYYQLSSLLYGKTDACVLSKKKRHLLYLQLVLQKFNVNSWMQHVYYIMFTQSSNSHLYVPIGALAQLIAKKKKKSQHVK